jgi:hypothetical protein
MATQQSWCPAESTQGATPATCVMTCPTGFELRTVDGAQRCVNKNDPNITIHLVPQTAVPRTNGDDSLFRINDLDPTSDAGLRYRAEASRFKAEVAAARGNVSREKEIAAAALALQNAAPGDATTLAKAAYMQLTGDPDSVTRQLDEAAESDAQKMTDRFRSEYQFLKNQATQQQTTLDLVNSVKDKLFSIKDDMLYSVGVFDKQVKDIRNQINLNKRQREQATDYGKWLSMGLNVAIVLALIFAIYVVGSKAMGRVNMSSAPSQGAPARAPATPETAEFFNSFIRHLTPASGTLAKKD